MRNLFWLFIILLTIGCKDANVQKELAEMKAEKPVDPKKLKLPSSCEMISQEKIKEIFKVKAPSVNLKDASDPADPKSKSCFFQWDDDDTPNAGIMIQLQTNPVFDDYNEYISKFVTSKLTEGETMLGDDKPTIYKQFDAGGADGAYSFQQARFYWNYGNNYLVMLAFNVSTLSESQMVNAAEDIAEEVNKNFIKAVR
ncbi:MAG: hypothetical protein IPO37_14775 [Saprospiraceae bacterium]|nr:hypothetical protein [Saprospiraceae bacterium]MBP6447699.1 hypothetical protein [Saprospiraceae bacterium]